MSGYTTKRVYSSKRNVDTGRGVDKAGTPSTTGMPVMLRRFTQARAPNPTKNNPTINGSLYFDGTETSRILIDNGADLELDGDFTIEWFQYQMNTKVNPAPRAFQIGNFEEGGLAYQAEFGFSIESSDVAVWMKNYDPNNSGPDVNDCFIDTINEANFIVNKWVHFAIVRENGSVKLYFNGTQTGNVLANTPLTLNSTNTKKLCIGNETIPSDNAAYEGYITNFRWTKGEALYTSNFQVPTSPLTALPGTKLLFLAQNKAPYANGKDAVTTVGNITWSPKSPFN